MGDGSAFLVSFLLAAFVCVIVVEGADRCDFNASIPCFRERDRGSAQGQGQGQGQGQQRMTVERLLNVFKRDDINLLCSNFDKMKVCVLDKTKDCDSDEKNPLKKIWVKMQDSINHVCVKNRQAFIDSRECLTKQTLSSATHNCETTHNIHRRFARHTCSDYQAAVKCVNAVIYDQCPTSKNIMDRLVRNILSLADIDHDCEQMSSGRRTEDSIVVRFILCTTSFMLVSLLN